ncbi:proton-conducting transporter transmembrane domain-containing protein [Thiohalobacter sp.]|uniref:proton-conducting transporter transmembrane domain-containing protein n=1 Tax=Thiohalobacter sp. TaxID=2025948 RepID=UPI00260C7CA5|nr:proton-conducting transporter membrane subunit [Thiohalobacter sp.]
MQQLLLLLPLTPLLSALAGLLAGPAQGRRVARISLWGAALAFGLSVLLLAARVLGDADVVAALPGDWPFLRLDPLGALMAWVIAGISLIVHAYSVRYMAEEPGLPRYFILLDLLVTALYAMVLAGDLLTLLVSWNLIGILLFFLLGHNVNSRAASRYAGWSLLTYRLGDLPLILAAALLFQAYGTFDLGAIFDALQADPGRTTLGGYRLAEVVAMLVSISAFARSAQFVLHAWLPYTMEGPTPVSALMHAGIVNAGGFIINRFAPVFIHTTEVLHWLFLIGLVTAIAGSILMLGQNDIKKSLGYSTMGQMGFMIMECGVGAFSLAIYHLIAHGIFKGTLFLGAGSIINEARRSDGVPKDPLYTFVVERRLAARRPPWLLMALMTLAVPSFILGLAHWMVDQEILQKQGAIVLLFFGWVTGAQLLFSTYKMKTANLPRLLALIIFSFTIVVIGYTLVAHVFDLFLYPDPEMRAALYAAANIDLFLFELVLAMIAVIVVLGWLLAYYADQRGGVRSARLSSLWLRFYALVSREFYVPDIYGLVSHWMLKVAERINRRLRWL